MVAPAYSRRHELGPRGRGYLHEPAGAAPRHEVGPEPAAVLNDGGHQRRVDAIAKALGVQHLVKGHVSHLYPGGLVVGEHAEGVCEGAVEPHRGRPRRACQDHGEGQGGDEPATASLHARPEKGDQEHRRADEHRQDGDNQAKGKRRHVWPQLPLPARPRADYGC